MIVKPSVTMILFGHLLIAALCGSCNQMNKNPYLLERRVVLRNDGKIEIVSIFPEIKLPKSNKKIDSLNSFLKHVNQLDELVTKDFRSDLSNEKISVVGNYSILSRSEDLVCFEYLVSVKETNSHVFKPIFIDLKRNVRVNSRDIFDVSDSRTLLPYVKRFCDSTQVDINTSVYERNDGTALVYGITRDSLILYLGGEGEDYGNYRISIPINNLHLNSRKGHK